MHRRSVHGLVATLTVVPLVGGCTRTIPRIPVVPTAPEARQHARGGWIELRYGGDGGGGRTAGELVAVDRDTLWVLSRGGARVVPTADVLDGQLVGYDPHGEDVAWATLIGTLSTASNGTFLVFTAPMWLIGGSVAVAGQSRTGPEPLPPSDWASLARFARFPQGIPRDLALESLRGGGG